MSKWDNSLEKNKEDDTGKSKLATAFVNEKKRYTLNNQG